MPQPPTVDGAETHAGPIERHRDGTGPAEHDAHPVRGASGRRGLWIALAAVACVSAAVASRLPAEVFWSPDEGAKLLQALSHRRGGATADAIPYGGRALDPDLSFYPRPLHHSHPASLLSALYPQPTGDGGVRVHWPAAFPILSLPPFRVLGARGLYLLPLIAGLAAAAVAGALARGLAPGAGGLAVLAVGLASPLLFYSQLFWEHAPATALALAAVLVLACETGTSPPRLLGAAALLAGAVALRPESLLLAAVLPLSLLTMGGDRPPRPSETHRLGWAALAGGVVLATALVCLIPWGRGALIGWLETAVSTTSSLVAFLGKVATLMTPFPARLADAWFDLDVALGPALPDGLARIGTAGVVLALAATALREPLRGWAVVAGGCLVLGPSLWALVSPEPYRSIHALILPAPYLALVAPLLRPPASAQRRPVVFLGVTVVLYLALGTVLSMTKLVGGLEWGSRYLLTLTALGAVAAAVGASIYGRRDGERRPRRAVVAVTVVCLVVGGGFQVRGVRELVISKRALDACRLAILEADRPTVTDLYWLPAAVAVTFAERPVFTLRDRGDLGRWVGRIGGREGRFLLVTGHDDEADVRRWLAAYPEPPLEPVGVRRLPGLLLVDVEVGAPDGRRVE
ncbi:MAG: hypothetical protein MUC56_17950 [Thermoanaerobaculales bacterium]|jgi:hypothetical protein|nr:hypothetical protein [Thermoanaerobaculales bacterium]